MEWVLSRGRRIIRQDIIAIYLEKSPYVNFRIKLKLSSSMFFAVSISVIVQLASMRGILLLS